MKSFFCSLIFLISSQLVLAQDSKDMVSNKLVILQAGKQIGQETYILNTKTFETAESTSKLSIDLETSLDFKTKTFYQKTFPKEFTLQQKPNLELNCSINGSKVSLTGTHKASGETDLESLFLENNVWYQYIFLIHRYDHLKNGIQKFKALVPSILQTIPISLELKEKLQTIKNFPVKINIYNAFITDDLQINLITDENDSLLYIAIPVQNVEVINEKYINSLKTLQALNPKIIKEIDYSVPPSAKFTAEEVTISTNGYVLAGTLLTPKDFKPPFPAVITITGSGQETRDEPLPIPGLEKYRIFRQVAETLATEGIAVLRVDDRGVGKSTGFETLKTATTTDFAKDIEAQIAFLRTRKEIDPKRIALVGHSEGGMIAPMIAATDTRIAAIVLLGAPGKRGDLIITEQQNFILKNTTEISEEEKNKSRAEQQEIMQAVIQGKDLSKYPAEVRFPWFKEFLIYDPIQMIKKVKQPILILQGELDRQVFSDNAKMLSDAASQSGNKNVKVIVYPNLNHLFLAAKTGAVSEYSSLGTSAVGTEVLNNLRDWLSVRLNSKIK